MHRRSTSGVFVGASRRTLSVLVVACAWAAAGEGRGTERHLQSASPSRLARRHIGSRHSPLLAAGGTQAAALEEGSSSNGAAYSGAGSEGLPVSASWTRIIVAYMLWLLFGIAGAHHLYLGRNRAALLCSMRLGQQLPRANLDEAQLLLRRSRQT